MRNPSDLVEIRLYRKADLGKPWQDVPISSYLPVFLTGEQNEENLKKRLYLIYFRSDPTIEQLSWNFRGTTEVVFLKRIS